MTRRRASAGDLPPNHKLGALLIGRTVRSLERDAGGDARLTTDDGTVVTVRLPHDATLPTIAGAPRVAGVWQRGTTLRLTTSDGDALDLVLAEATSSVLARGEDGAFLYSD